MEVESACAAIPAPCFKTSWDSAHTCPREESNLWPASRPGLRNRVSIPSSPRARAWGGICTRVSQPLQRGAASFSRTQA